MVLIIASLGTTAGAPSSDRSEDSARRAQPVILDYAPGHPVPGLAGPESLILPLNRVSNPRKKQNEAKAGEIAQVMPARPPRVVHPSDRSRGPPGPAFDPSSAARYGSEASEGRAVAAPRALDRDGPSRRVGRADVSTAGFLPDPSEKLATSGR